MTPNPEMQRRNRRLGLILASVAIVFMLGFIVRMTFFGSGGG